MTEKRTLKPSCFNHLETLDKITTGKKICLSEFLLPVLELQTELSARASEQVLNL